MKSLLIIKLGALGDGIMLLPAVAEVRRRYPDCAITWVAGPALFPLLNSMQGSIETGALLQRVVLHHAPNPGPFSVLRTWAQCLNAKVPRFDTVLVGNPHPAYLAFALPWALSSRVLRFRPALTDYHPAAYLETLGLASAKPIWPELPVGDLGFLKSFENRPRPWTALFPGGARNELRDDPHRRWPLEHYAKLAHDLRGQGGTVWILGAESDRWTLRGSNFEGCEIQVGQWSVLQTLSALTQMDHVVSHDTGPMHLAHWAVQTDRFADLKLHAIFGPTRPSTRLDQNHSEIKVHWGGQHLTCRPCYDGREYPPCEHLSCVRSVTVDALLSSIGVDKPTQPSFQPEIRATAPGPDSA